jgi:hypothetical protein
MLTLPVLGAVFLAGRMREAHSLAQDAETVGDSFTLFLPMSPPLQYPQAPGAFPGYVNNRK